MERTVTLRQPSRPPSPGPPQPPLPSLGRAGLFNVTFNYTSLTNTRKVSLNSHPHMSLLQTMGEGRVAFHMLPCGCVCGACTCVLTHWGPCLHVCVCVQADSLGLCAWCMCVCVGSCVWAVPSAWASVYASIRLPLSC